VVLRPRQWLVLVLGLTGAIQTANMQSRMSRSAKATMLIYAIILPDVVASAKMWFVHMSQSGKMGTGAV